jgi:hypothetical protein
MSRPWSRIWPLVGSSKPATIRSVVVLPQPDGPSSEKNSPSAMRRSTCSTARTSPAAEENRFSTPTSSIAGSPSSSGGAWRLAACTLVSAIALVPRIRLPARGFDHAGRFGR